MGLSTEGEEGSMRHSQELLQTRSDATREAFDAGLPFCIGRPSCAQGPALFWHKETRREVMLGDGRKSSIVVASMNVQQLDFRIVLYGEICGDRTREG